MKLRLFPAFITSIVTLISPAYLPAQPCAAGTPINPISLEFFSRGGVATLIGFDELTPPSFPPKKYLRHQVSATLYQGRWFDGPCELAPISFAWERGEANDNPNGYPFGPVSWSASLTPVGTNEAGMILYRASAAIGGRDPLTLRIVVDLGNSGIVFFNN